MTVLVSWQRWSVDDITPVGRVTQTHLVRPGLTETDAWNRLSPLENGKDAGVPLACGRKSPDSLDAAVEIVDFDDVEAECPRCRRIQAQADQAATTR